jgi:uncharacterized protein (DUF4415 family)
MPNAAKREHKKRRASGTPAPRARSRALTSLTDQEIERMAARDTDNPAADEAYWASAAVGLPAGKTYIHAGFDSDVVRWFKSKGRGYQTRMNAVLRRYMEAQRKAG